MTDLMKTNEQEVADFVRLQLAKWLLLNLQDTHVVLGYHPAMEEAYIFALNPVKIIWPMRIFLTRKNKKSLKSLPSGIHHCPLPEDDPKRTEFMKKGWQFYLIELVQH